MNIKRSVLLVLFIVFCQSGFAQDNTNTLIISRGDAIRILVYDGANVPDETRFISQFHNQEFIVDGNGYIRFLSLGMVKIADLKVEEIEGILAEKLKPYGKNPNVIVIPLIRLVLRGEFGSPGMYRFSVNTSF